MVNLHLLQLGLHDDGGGMKPKKKRLALPLKSVTVRDGQWVHGAEVPGGVLLAQGKSLLISSGKAVQVDSPIRLTPGLKALGCQRFNQLKVTSPFKVLVSDVFKPAPPTPRWRATPTARSRWWRTAPRTW